MYRYFCYLSLFVLILFGPVFGVSPLYQAMLQDANSARGVGMGMSGIALESDGSGLFQNAAGLVPKGYFYQYESFDLQAQTLPLAYGHFFHVGPVSIGTVHGEDLNKNRLYATTIGFSQRGKNNFDWGVLYKGWQEVTASDNTQAWSADLGVVYHLNKALSLGVSVYDAIAGSPQAAPSSVGVGTALQLGDISFTLESMFRQTQDATMMRTGLECLLTDGLIVRGGWYNKAYTFGATLSVPVVDVTYAALYPQDKTQPARYLFSFSFFKEQMRDAPPKKK